MTELNLSNAGSICNRMIILQCHPIDPADEMEVEVCQLLSLSNGIVIDSVVKSESAFHQTLLSDLLEKYHCEYEPAAGNQWAQDLIAAYR